MIGSKSVTDAIQNARMTEGLDLAIMVEQVGAEQSASRFLKQSTRIPSMGKPWRVVIAEAVLACETTVPAA